MKAYDIWVDLKGHHKDAILFVQYGDFYETFEDDAAVVGRAIVQPRYAVPGETGIKGLGLPVSRGLSWLPRLTAKLRGIGKPIVISVPAFSHRPETILRQRVEYVLQPTIDAWATLRQI